MTINESIRVNKVLKEFNIGLSTLVDFLKSKKIEIAENPSVKIDPQTYELIKKEFGKEQLIKEKAKNVPIKINQITKQSKVKEQEEDVDDNDNTLIITETTLGLPPAKRTPKIIGHISDLNIGNKTTPVQNGEAASTKKDVQTTITTVDEQLTPLKTKEPDSSFQKPIDSLPQVLDVKIEIPEKQIVEKEDIKIKIDNPPQKKEDELQKKSIEVLPKSKDNNTFTPDKKSDNTKNSGAIETKSTEREQSKRPNEFNKANASKGGVTPPSNQNDSNVVEHIETKVQKLAGPKISGTIDLSQFDKKKSDSKPSYNKDKNKGKRERIKKTVKEKVDLNKESKDVPKNVDNRDKSKIKKKDHKQHPNAKDKFKPVRHEVDEDAVQKQIKETYARMVEGKGKTKGSRHRRDKRELVSQKNLENQEIEQTSSSTLKVTEFVTVNDLAVMMDVAVTKVIEACMNLGLMVSINQRLDAEAMILVAEEFGFKVEIVTVDNQEDLNQEIDSEDVLVKRPPIVTVMGHVDHGKTSLLDYVRKANVIAGEAGGITQHIGAYNVKLSNGERITFLDTPGHEAFTAMRARGAKVTDIAIIIVAADDAIMPQTKEAINHAQAAGVPMIFAINKIDKPGAYPEKIREQLANMNILVEDWGGKYQCQEISAKHGLNVDKLLEKVLLESEILELKANPDRRANGTIIESSLDKGRGYVATVLVQNGTLSIGDIILSGCNMGKIKAMFNERGQKIDKAGPSTPVSILGLNGAPAAGELFNVMTDEKEAKEIANKREQLVRIQGLKTQKHITLEEIGRRIAVGNFQELNIIVKGDVDGSIEALSDSLIKLSTEEIAVNVIHKAVGAISESDVLLAVASNAIIIGFQVRPSVNARKLAEKEEIEIRLYSVIYDAINEVKDGIEGMLAPEQKEEVTATAEVRETFKISKIGTIAGCMVKDGKLTRNAKVRIIRDGIVVYTGVLGSLKRFKEDVKEVASGYDCGTNIDGYNDIKIGDLIEAYTIVEIKRKLS